MCFLRGFYFARIVIVMTFSAKGPRFRPGIGPQIAVVMELITRFLRYLGYVHSPLDTFLLPRPLLRFPSWFVLPPLASPLPRLP